MKDHEMADRPTPYQGQCITLKAPGALRVKPDSVGCNQAWFHDPWQQQAGCASCALSNALWYWQRRKSVRPARDDRSKSAALHMMEDAWHYVTPSAMGVNDPNVFRRGAENFFRKHGHLIETELLSLPQSQRNRPTLQNCAAFLTRALSADIPPAFLNYANGKLQNLESWHWVSVVGLKSNQEKAELLICDQGELKRIDWRLWLKTSLLGGHLVAFFPQS